MELKLGIRWDKNGGEILIKILKSIFFRFFGNLIGVILEHL